MDFQYLIRHRIKGRRLRDSIIAHSRLFDPAAAPPQRQRHSQMSECYKSCVNGGDLSADSSNDSAAALSLPHSLSRVSLFPLSRRNFSHSSRELKRLNCIFTFNFRNGVNCSIFIFILHTIFVRKKLPSAELVLSFVLKTLSKI